MINNRAKLRARINNTRKILKDRLPHMSVEEVIDHATLLSEYAYELGRNEVYQSLLGEASWIPQPPSKKDKK